MDCIMFIGIARDTEERYLLWERGLYRDTQESEIEQQEFDRDGIGGG
jgi:hypothetical protein